MNLEWVVGMMCEEVVFGYLDDCIVGLDGVVLE